MKHTGIITVEFTIRRDSTFTSDEHFQDYLQTVLKEHLTAEGQIYKISPVMETLTIKE